MELGACWPIGPFYFQHFFVTFFCNSNSFCVNWLFFSHMRIWWRHLFISLSVRLSLDKLVVFALPVEWLTGWFGLLHDCCLVGFFLNKIKQNKKCDFYLTKGQQKNINLKQNIHVYLFMLPYSFYCIYLFIHFTLIYIVDFMFLFCHLFCGRVLAHI